MWILAVAVAAAAPEPFEAVLDEALSRGPGAVAIEARRAAGVAGARSRGALLANPEAELERVAGELEARVTVPVPVALQPVARARIARAGADAAEATGDLERVRFAEQVGLAYLELQRAHERALLAEDTLALALRSREAARALRATGEIGGVDAAVAEAQAAREVAVASLAQQEVRAWSLALEALIGRPPTGELAPAGWPDLPPPPLAEPAAVPAVRAAEAIADERRAAATLAVMDLVQPSLIVGATEGSPIVGVSMPLPILSPGIAGIRAAGAEARAAEAEAGALRLDTTALLEAARRELAAAEAAAADTAVDGLRPALAELGNAFTAGEFGLAEFLSRRDALVAGIESGIDARFRLERARLALWALAGRVPGEETP